MPFLWVSFKRAATGYSPIARYLFGMLSIILLTDGGLAEEVRDHLVRVERSIIQFAGVPETYKVWASGICINPNCSVVATAYHTQMLIGKKQLRVAGGHTTKVLSLANESDTNKAALPYDKKILSLNMAHDISFLYTKHSVPHKSGASLSYSCYVGEIVQVAGFNDRHFETRSARIIGLNVLMINGGAELEENMILDVTMDRGTSGSGVFDERGRLLGMIILSGTVRFGDGNLPVSESHGAA